MIWGFISASWYSGGIISFRLCFLVGRLSVSGAQLGCLAVLSIDPVLAVSAPWRSRVPALGNV